MRIKSIHLRNIRSYTDGGVEFPDGSTLLSGDIGCGKSTLLHAIEFALFGTKKGELGGSDLLRHGKSSGVVKLNFELDGNNISIERTLKRGRDSITQDNGLLKVNGTAHSMTATELKSRVLDMLGYSQDMLRRNKPLFRYTVYTPQEHMKHIMFDKEQRLTTLRTIFGIDKYGTIRNNSRIIMTELRAMKRENEAFSKDVEIDISKLGELKESRKNVAHIIFDEKLKLGEIGRRLAKQKDELDLVKKDFDMLNAKKHELTRKEAELKSKESRLGRLSGEIISIEEKISSLKSELDISGNLNLTGLKNSLYDLENRRDILIEERAVLKKEIQNLHPVYEKGVCSVCGQSVQNRDEFRKHIESKRERLGAVDEELASLDSIISNTKDSITSAERYNHLKRVHDDAAKRKDDMLIEKGQLDNDVATLIAETDEIKPQLERYDKISSEIMHCEKILNEIMNEKMAAEKNISRLEQQAENFEAHISEVTRRIEDKQQAKAKSARIGEIVNWFDPFVGLMETMEKHVMVAIQKEFNQHFQHWFGLVMGDQFTVRIDEQFTPKIEQNSYETDYENLSGGEKTSVALAYRLALNKVINSMIDNIKTKDLLILDEPTDGFSTDQLDRIRDVINELNLKQIIIVSHEPKIDTYVDNVIRIFKENHVSRVAY